MSAIVQTLIDAVAAGVVGTSDEVLGVLRRHGEITRDGDHSISICLHGQRRPTRLKGLLFERSLDVEAIKRAVVKHADCRKAVRTDAGRAQAMRMEMDRMAG